MSPRLRRSGGWSGAQPRRRFPANLFRPDDYWRACRRYWFASRPRKRAARILQSNSLHCSFRTSFFISRTACWKPTIKGRATMLWPIFSSPIWAIAATVGRCDRSGRARRAGLAGLDNSRPALESLTSSACCWLAWTGKGVLPGVQLHGVGTQLGDRLRLPLVGVQKQADYDARILQAVEWPRPAVRGCQATSSPPSVVTSSRFSGTSVAWSGRIRRRFENVAVARQFQVQLDGDRFPQQPQVAVLNMPAILAQMDRDSVGTPNSASMAAQTGSGS